MNIIKLLNKVSIRSQLIIMALALCLMLAVGGLFGILDSYILNQKAQNIDKANELKDDAMELKVLLLQERVYSEEMMSQDRRYDLNAVWNQKKTASAKINDLEEKLNNYKLVKLNFIGSGSSDTKSEEEVKELVNKIFEMNQKEYEPALQKAHDLVLNIQTGKISKNSQELSNVGTQIDTVSNNILLLADDLESEANAIIAEAVKSAEDTFNIAWYQLLFMISLAVAMTTFAAIYFTGTITKPLKKLEDLAKEISQGNLNIKIDEDITERGDEIGVLGNSLAIVIANFRGIVSNIKNSAISISTIGKNLSVNSAEVKSASEQVSYTMQEISKGTQTLSRTASENQKEAENLMNSIEIVTNSVTNSMKNANEANAIALDGSKASKIAMDKIGLIKHTVSSSANAINALNDKVQKINKIVEVITSVSEQTNLLALNAAIEAARAGDSGRGFAVVADEVRKLAEESQKSTSQIDMMIKEIKESTIYAVNLMQKGTAEVDDSIQTISGALNSLELISVRMSQIAVDVEQINQASQAQTRSSKTMQKSTTDVNTVANENASGTEEVVTSSISTTNALSEIASSAKQLATHSEELKLLVDKFKI